MAHIAGSVAAGDTVRIKGGSIPSDMAQTATWTNQSTVVLASSVTATVTLCQSAWTNSTNVTCTTSGDRKEGTLSINNAIAGAFTTGLAAFFATGTLDLSAYQQLTFWIKSDTAVAASSIRVDLCTDTVGAVPVNSFTISRALNASVWTPITIDSGGNLNSAIASIAMNVLIDLGGSTVNVKFDDILACKAASAADSLSLTSLIGQNDGIWWGLRSINGTTLIVDINPNASNSTAALGWSGTTGTAEIWKVETIKTPKVAASNTVVTNAPVNGTSGNVVTISGGWNTTDMSTQDAGDITICDGLDGFGIAFSCSKNYTTWSNIGTVRYDTGWNVSTTSVSNNTWTIPVVSNCTQTGLVLDGPNHIVTSAVGVGHGGAGVITHSAGTATNVTITALTSLSCNAGMNLGVSTGRLSIGTIVSSNNNGVNLTLAGNSTITTSGTFNYSVNGNHGFTISSSFPIIMYNITSTHNTDSGITFTKGTRHRIYGLTTSNNTTSGINATISSGLVNGAELFFYNASITDSTRFSTITAEANLRFYSNHEGGVVTTNKIYSDGGTSNVIAQTVTSPVSSPSTVAWELTSGSTDRDAMYPVVIPLASLLVQSGKTLTFTADIRRSSTTAMVAQLVIPGGRVSGVGSAGTNVVTTAAGSANTYTTETITVTPSATDVIEIFFQGYNTDGSSVAYVSNCTISVV